MALKITLASRSDNQRVIHWGNFLLVSFTTLAFVVVFQSGAWWLLCGTLPSPEMLFIGVVPFGGFVGSMLQRTFAVPVEDLPLSH